MVELTLLEITFCSGFSLSQDFYGLWHGQKTVCLLQTLWRGHNREFKIPVPVVVLQSVIMASSADR